MQTQHRIKGGGGLELNVLEWGKPRGRPLLLIHGWSQAYPCWEKQYQSALADEFRIVALDLRGHGMSAAPLEQAAYTDSKLWADDIQAVIATLSLERPVLAGWSYGGLVISDYLKVYGDSAIAGINFVSASVRLGASAFGTLIGNGFIEPFPRATSGSLAESIDGIRDFIERCFAVKLSRQDYERVLCFNMTARPDVRASLAAREFDATEVLRKVTAPVLITQGRKDTMVLPAMAEFIASLIPHAQMSWYDEVAHGPFMEDAARFNDELAAFTRAANA